MSSIHHCTEFSSASVNLLAHGVARRARSTNIVEKYDLTVSEDTLRCLPEITITSHMGSVFGSNATTFCVESNAFEHELENKVLQNVILN